MVADAPFGRGGSWGTDDTILFTPQPSGEIYRVDASGIATRITTKNAATGEDAHYWPMHLPGNERFVYFARGRAPENSGLYMAPTDGSGAPTRIVSTLSNGIYVPPRRGAAGDSGHLLWVRDSELIAQPFDARSGELSGTPTTIAHGVRVDESQLGMFASASHNGVLVWATALAASLEFSWYDRNGVVLAPLTGVEPGALYMPAVSPDGTKVLFVRAAAGLSNIWIHDRSTGSTRRATNNPGYDEYPSWSHDGQWMLYSDGSTASGSISIVAPDASSSPRRLYEGFVGASYLSPDNAYAVFQTIGPDAGWDLWAVSVDEPNTAFELDNEPGNYDPGPFSPDGRWLLSASDRTGRKEVYAARWVTGDGRPRLGGPWIQVSNDGGARPVWSRQGREILFESADGYVNVVPVRVGENALELGRIERLARIPLATSTIFGFGFVADGSEFLFTTAPHAGGQALRVITNWQERLGEAR